MSGTGYFDIDHHPSPASTPASTPASFPISSSYTLPPFEDPFGIFARPMAPTPAPFVYINGWPGVGKLAVAECLALLMGGDRAQLINVRDLGTDQDDWDLHEESEANTGDELTRLLSESHGLRRMVIMTHCTPDTPSGRTAAETYAAAASRAGRLFVPVCLECQPAEHLQRMQSLERQCSQRGRKRAQSDPARPPLGRRLTFQSRGQRPGKLGEKKALTLDVTRMEALQAAVQVLEFVNDAVTRFEQEWYCGSAAATPVEERMEWRQAR